MEELDCSLVHRPFNEACTTRFPDPQMVLIRVELQCDFCKNETASRLSSWAVACGTCSLANHTQYNVNDPRLSARLSVERFPRNHRGAKICTVCTGTYFVILYDEVDDEWLFCGDCKNFKQLLRCWNMYSNLMINLLEKPIVRSLLSVEQIKDNLYN